MWYLRRLIHLLPLFVKKDTFVRIREITYYISYIIEAMSSHTDESCNIEGSIEICKTQFSHLQ